VIKNRQRIARGSLPTFIRTRSSNYDCDRSRSAGRHATSAITGRRFFGTIQSTGFNRRKMEDDRRRLAQKQAAERRATDPQIVEDAARVVAAWNERREKRMPMLFSPTIGAAIAARYWFLWVRCPACRTINAIDLRTLDCHRDAAITSLIPVRPVARAGRMRRSPILCVCRKGASPMKCAKNIGGECSVSDSALTALPFGFDALVVRLAI
jgi:hypothetical protein